LVNVIVQVAPDVAKSLLLTPVQPVYCVPTATALFLLAVMVVRSVFRAANTEIKLPVVGAVLDVIVVPVWLPMLDMVLTRLAQFVAVTVPSALTVLSADCPQPLSPDPVLQMSLTLAPAVVLAKPL